MATIIFDFDNTIADTSSLEMIRVSQAWSSLNAHTMAGVTLYPQILGLLTALKASGVRMAIVTNSPEKYLHAALEYLGVSDYFEVAITYNDVGPSGKKPSPDGINLALSRMGLEPSFDILYVGDDRIDYEAAYRAGVLPVMPTWVRPISVSTPPALEMSSGMLLEFIENPDDFQLMAERCADLGALVTPMREHYILALDESASVVSNSRDMVGICLGRYFSRNSEVTAPLHFNHNLSRKIAEKENEGAFEIPREWVNMMVHVIKRSSDFIFEDGEGFDLITVIPAKVGKDPRLERFLNMVGQELGDEGSNITFDSDIFSYVEGARSQKTLLAAERQIEAMRSLHLRNGKRPAVQGKRVLVIDDVVTTGATLRRARAILQENGAESCYSVVIAKTVSVTGAEKLCDCGRVMRVRVKKKTGELFWGCTGYFEDKVCTGAVDIVSKSCQVCGSPMRVKENKRGQMFWGCSGYSVNNCRYTESY